MADKTLDLAAIRELLAEYRADGMSGKDAEEVRDRIDAALGKGGAK